MTIISGCLAPPPEELLRAVHEFNRGEWFECHETLEELWVGSVGELRHLYQGLLQIAVALHHWKNGNYGGAISLLNKGPDCLSRVRNVCQCLQVDMIAADALHLRKTLEILGPEQMATVDSALIPQLRLLPGEAEQTGVDPQHL